MSNSGFTLIETIVSLIIAVVASVLFHQLISTGLRSSTTVTDQERLLNLAQSRIAEIGHSVPLATGTKTGRSEDGLYWQVWISPHSGQVGHKFRTFKVKVRTQLKPKSQNSQAVELVTIKLGSRQ